jgi:polyphosphate glucokinase
MVILGVDIGGSGIKGAPVDTSSGVLLAPRYRIPTPEGAKPRPMAEVVGLISQHFDWQGTIGVGFPSVIRNGIVRSAANIHKKWLDTHIDTLISEATGCPTYTLNDADAAGLAEMTFGAGKDRGGVVMIITIGTGLGSALFTNGELVPHTEFGHIEIRGMDAERRASDMARKVEKLSWKQWAGRLDEYLHTLERLLWPDVFILGGGVVKQHEKFIPLLTVEAEVVPAQFLNDAGIVGAALAARQAARDAAPDPDEGSQKGNQTS